MSYVFNMVGGSSGGGGGPSASDAILTVTAPAGSTVTATKGGTSLTPTMWTAAADATQECALFVIPSAQFDSVNPWTVTATSGTDTISDTVTIDSNKQYDVELSCNLYLIRDGVIKYNYTSQNLTVTPITGGSVRIQTTGNGGRFAFQLTSDILTQGAIYSQLVVRHTGMSDSGYIYYGINTSLSSGTESSWLVYAKGGSGQTYPKETAFDISGITYFGNWFAYKISFDSLYADISDVYLVK